MKEELHRLGRQSLVYGVGHVGTRVINFLLLPLYTHRLLPQEYGVVALAFVFIAFANVLLLHGMDSAMLRFYGLEKHTHAKRAIFSTGWLWLLITTCLFCLAMLSLSGSIALFTIGESHRDIILLAIGILFFDALVANPKILLRLQNRPTIFISVELMNVLLIASLNIWWIGFQHRSVQFIFLSNLIASASVFIVLLFLTRKEIELRLDSQRLREQLRFALPYIPAGLASMITELSDRYMLKWLVDESAVGIYTAGYRLGIFMLVVVMAFKYAWQPFFLDRAADPHAPEVFARVGTYFLALNAFIFLTLSFFIDPLVRTPIAGQTFFGAAYWQGTTIVPVILLAYIFLGVFLVQLPGIYIRRKSGWIPILNGSAALVNIALNLVLIRRYGWQGAAWATLASYVFLAVLQFMVVRRFYPLRWEWPNVLKIAGVTTALLAGHVYLSTGVPTSVLLLLLYPVALVALRLVKISQLQSLLGWLKA